MRLRSASYGYLVAGAALALLAPPNLAWSQNDDPPAAVTEEAVPEEAAADDVLDIEYTEEEQRQIDLADRFLTILLRNPREGTALDRVYGHHLEFGTLDKFVARLEAELKEDDTAGDKWMVLAMFQARRGEDEAAINAYKKAEEHRPDDPIPAYYLGQTLLRLSKNDEAVAAMERALTRDPARADQLEIFQQLGRIHQRAQRTDEALAVWQRLEELYPDDTRVLEQIATTLAEEGEPELALQRYERLTKLERDDYQRTMYRVKVAELTIKTEDRTAGIAAFEAILADLNPEGWLYRDVRRRIETTFLQSGDQDSLVAYYEAWLEKHPEDVEGMVRLAQFLASTARMPEAREWMDKAITLAPSRGDLRKSYIRLLVDDQQFTEAAEQYRVLSETDPDNPDVLMDWGKLVLRDTTMPMEKRKEEAERIWQKIIANQPQDALTHAQVADALRHAEMKDQALKLYQKAVELAPTDPQYKEFLGEFYHILKQPEKAKETWLSIAEPPNRSADNLARVAEVFHGFGLLDEALASISEACEVDPKDFALHMKAADYQAQAKNYDKALAMLDIAQGLATHEDQKEAEIAQRIELYQSSDQLDERTEELAAQINAKENPTPEDWNLLARFQSASSNFVEASRSINKALEIDPKSIVALTTAARIAETSGDFGHAADLSGKLAEIDRRSRGDHLMSVVRLEIQMGRQEKALKAAQDLIRSAPGNTEHYQFYSQTCFRLGRADEGLEALRKAIRINPNEPALIMALGSALGDQFKTREAIELYWRAFDKTDELDDKTTLITKLVPLYDQLNEFDTIVERLEANRRSQDQRRAMTICLAQAYQSSGDTGAARAELESLLSENTRDTNLLQQLAKLCESSGDIDAAIDYQRQLVSIAPGHETEFPLAVMLSSVGRNDEASEIYMRLTRREEDPRRLLTSIDSLLTQGNYEAVVRITEPMVEQNRTNWEVIYRNGVALASLDKFDEAKEEFQAVLDLELPHDTLGLAAKDRLEQQRRRARSNNLQGQTTVVQEKYNPYQSFSSAYQVREATGYQATASGGVSSSGRAPRVWTPDAYGVARMAAYAWLLEFRSKADQETKKDDEAPSNTEEELVAELEKRAKADDADRSTIWDYLYVCNLRTDGENIFEIAKKLAKDGTNEDKAFLLSSLRMRNRTPNMSPNEAVPEATEPLSDEELELVMQCYEELGDQEPPEIAAGAQIVYASNGQAYIRVGNSYQVLQGVYRGGSAFMTVVSKELKLAGREEKAEEVFEAGLAEAKTSQELMRNITLLQQEDKLDRVPGVFEKWAEVTRQELVEEDPMNGTTAANRGSQLGSATYPLCQWIGRLSADKEYDEIKKVLQSYVDLAVIDLINQREASSKSRGRRVSSSSMQGQPRRIGVQVYQGTNANYVQIEVLFDDSLLSSQAIQLLRQCFEVLKQNGEEKGVEELLRKGLQDVEPGHRPYHQLMLAQVMAWRTSPGDILPLVTEAAEQLPQQADFQLQIAQLHLNRDNFDDAMQVLEGIESYDQSVIQQRELLALRAAERLGDFERARTAAERLFGSRLNNQMQIQLAQTMQRLGMNDMADAILSRAERTIGNDPQALASMMTMYQTQGKSDQAKQAARRILQRTQIASAGSPRTSTAQRDAAVRQQALRLLKQAGELDEMIKDLEERIERSPNSPQFYQELAELLQLGGNSSDVLPLLSKAVEAQPKSVDLRMALAQALETSGKRSEACDQYLEVLKLQPQNMMRDLSRYRNVFQQADRLDDLANVVVDMDSRQISEPYYVLDLAQQVLRKDADSESGLKLMEKVYEDFPQYRSQLLSNASPQIFRNSRFFDIAKRSIMPTASQIKSDPWYGFHQINSLSGDGTVHSSTWQLLESLKDSPKLEVIKDLLKKSIKSNSDWQGGKAMLVQIAMLEGHKAEARKELKGLLSDEKTVSNMSGTASWLVGQLAYELGEMDETTLTLYEQANTKQTSMVSSQIEYSPVSRLVTLYKKADRIEDAKNLILESVDKVDTRYAQPYMNDSLAQNYLWGAEKLLELNLPIDSMRICQDLLGKKEEMAAAAQYRGRQGDYYQQQAKKGIDKAIKALTKSDAKFDPQLLLSANPESKEGTAALELMFTVPSAAELGQQKITSALAGLILQLCDKPEMASAVEKRLLELRKERPEDISIGVLLLVLQSELDSPARGETIEQLVKTVNEQARDQTTKEDSLALWLAAQQIDDPKQWESSGLIFAKRAQEGLEAESAEEAKLAIIYEWADHALELQQREEAEGKLTELLALVTKRPESSRRNESDKIFLPPLVMSQFNRTIAVAKRAAENGMPELSRYAVEEALKAGMPVADAPSTANASTAGMIGFVPAPSTRSSSNNSAAHAAMTAVANAAVDVVRLWKGSEYPPEKTYEVLRNVILPESRSGECFIYPLNRDRQDTKVESLGDHLIEAAKAADRIDELKQEVEKRKAKSGSPLMFDILLTKLSMAQNDLPAAKQYLVDIAKELLTVTNNEALELACHVALPAMEHEELSSSAFTIVKMAARSSEEANSGNTGSYVPDKLTELVCKHALKNGNPEAVQEHFDNLLVSRQATYSRYGGDYGLYMQRMDLVAFANQAARMGGRELTLNFMGRAYDFEVTNYGSISLTEPLLHSIDYTRSLPPEERYQAWLEWTLPNPNRKTIRSVMERAPRWEVPEQFTDSQFDVKPYHGSPWLSNFNELVAAAQEAGKLDELTAAVKPLVGDMPGAIHLYKLCLAVDEDTDEAELASYFNYIHEERNKASEKRDKHLNNGILVFYACLDSNNYFTQVPERFLPFRDDLRSLSGNDVAPATAAFLAHLAGERHGTLMPEQPTNLKHWAETSLAHPQNEMAPSFWVPYEDQVVQLCGHNASWLQLNYPLLGDFTLSFDAFRGTWSEGYFGYAGVVIDPMNSSRTPIVFTNGAEKFDRKTSLAKGEPSFNRIEIRKQGDQCQYLCDGYVIFEEDLSNTSPWLMLATYGARVTSYRNFHIEGDPQIPSEVHLIRGDRMDGWSCGFFNESQPRHHLMAEPSPQNNSYLSRQQQEEPTEFDWRAEDDILVGRANSQMTEAESWVYYKRPLGEGESLTYEFYYEPGKSLVSPTIGNNALLLTEEGVQTRWLIPNQYRFLVERKDSIKEAAYRQAETLAMKENDWNSGEIRRRDGIVTLLINAKPVYQRPASEINDLRFGFYRTRDLAAQVRQVVLQGNWPSDIKQVINSDALATVAPMNEVDQQIVETMVNPEMQQVLVREIVAKSKEMDDRAAYDYLAAWVLPNEEHQTWRLYLDYAAPPEDGSPTLTDCFVSPAAEMVQRAASLGELDQLQATVEKLDPPGLVAQRSKKALLTLIALYAGDWETARARYQDVCTERSASLLGDLSFPELMPELLVAIEMGKQDEVWPLGLALARELRSDQRDGKNGAGGARWAHMVQTANGAIEIAHVGQLADTTPQRLTQWSEVPYFKAAVRGEGEPLSQWIYQRGSLSHMPGDTWNQLIFQSPLEGSYEINVRRSSRGYREGVVSVGRRSAEPNYNLKNVKVTTVAHGQSSEGDELELPVWDRTADYRIVVDGKTITTFTNGVQIYEDKLPGKPDPWVVIQAHSPGNETVIRDLRILGSPNIPDEIEPLDSANWWAWRADYYGDWHSQDENSAAPYVKKGDELVGNLRTDRSSAPLESLMMYTRPMLEDGVIEYESFYLAGKSEVHPTLGRTAWLLETDGVANHTLTNAQYETTGLAVDNRQPLSDIAPALVENGWNKVRLTLQGDEVTIDVNGTQVAKQTISMPPGERFFGFFRYSDKTECRVRNLTYRGEWPKELPPVADQQLAYASEGPLALADDEVAQTTEIKLGRSIEALQEDGIRVFGPQEHFSVDGDKLAIDMKKGGDGARWPGVEKKVSLTGDAEITVDFHALDVKQPEDGWGANLSLVVHLDDPYKTKVDNAVGVTAKGEPINNASLRRNLDGKQEETFDFDSISQNATSGKLRIVRRDGQIHCLSALGEGEPFRLIQSFTVGDAKIWAITVRAKASDDNAEVKCAVGGITIRETKPTNGAKK